jgi:EAL domain-containing protein (putative c-di-GMP-specific phosphodiesterase class I)/CHASE2 domain-containing sensor protein
MTGEKSLWSESRTKHLAIALAISALIGILGIVVPLNSLFWVMQSRALQHQASGDIVFIGAQGDPGEADQTSARAGLADVIDRLTAAGARRIFVDIDLEQPGPKRDDAVLNRAAKQSGRTVFVDRYATRGASARLVSPAPSVAQGVPSVVRKEWVDHFGYTWTSPYSVKVGGTTYPSFPAALAGRAGPPEEEFYIDYSTSFSSIPSYTMAEAHQLLADPPQARTFSGKTIVIGTLPSRGGTFASIPGVRVMAESYTGIFGAETLIHGPLRHISWYFPLLLIAGIVVLACRMRQPPRRRFAYAVATLVVPALLAASLWIGLVVSICEAIAFLLLYGAIRLWDRLYRRAPLVNRLSGLPTFEKLESDLSRARSNRPALVVAKIHRFDEVLASLPRAKHGEYMQLIASRLRMVDEGLVVYSNGGSNFAWLQQFAGLEQLRSHLIGMRAIFANALRIDDLSVDVGITFGADTSEDASAAKSISSALAAVDKTTESDNPVILANQASDEERRWNISLQARLDEAMKTGEIYLAYQPQFELETGKMFGAEALARWDDPERGEIPPSYFIEQCEQVGRMQALTKKVFEVGLGAVSETPFAGIDFNLSMNVSATMLNDFEVVRLLEESLAASRMVPKNVTIEMTETARIADLQTAALVMSQLKQLGVRLSADDFGVGAASFEPFLQLPFDELKIDRLFVSRIESDRKARKIVENLVKLGRDLDILVLAEGVEDQATFEVLRSLGCPAAQGYKLGRPTSLESVYHAWLAARAPQAATGAG